MIMITYTTGNIGITATCWTCQFVIMTMTMLSHVLDMLVPVLEILARAIEQRAVIG